ncbi:MAG TPA: 4Fe-4S binding protein [Bacteroidales bacterium]|nr:4Fe-4S binding protein [Bacteroidales bacterium]
MKKVVALYFSPTGGTAKVVRSMARAFAAAMGCDYSEINVTLPEQRKSAPAFGADDVVFFGVPTYIGRVPNLIRPFFASIKGCRAIAETVEEAVAGVVDVSSDVVTGGALGIPVVTYGNRAYDDALIELRDIMEENGFRTIAAAAFPSEHSFSTTLAEGRPNEKDLQLAKEFAGKVAETITKNPQLISDSHTPIAVPGNPAPYSYYKAVISDNKSIDIRKVKPITDPEKCTKCGICALLCPMGSINISDPSITDGICIKCGACIKRCPQGAKSITDPDYLEHKRLLEEEYGNVIKKAELFYTI